MNIHVIDRMPDERRARLIRLGMASARRVIRDHVPAVAEPVVAAPEPDAAPVLPALAGNAEDPVSVPSAEPEPVLKPRCGPTVRHIAEAACAFWNISMDDLLSRRRQRTVVLARLSCMYAAYKLTALSYPTIGRILNGREHSTICYGVQTISAILEGDSPKADQVRAFLRGLGE